MDNRPIQNVVRTCPQRPQFVVYTFLIYDLQCQCFGYLKKLAGNQHFGFEHFDRFHVEGTLSVFHLSPGCPGGPSFHCCWLHLLQQHEDGALWGWFRTCRDHRLGPEGCCTDLGCLGPIKTSSNSSSRIQMCLRNSANILMDSWVLSFTRVFYCSPKNGELHVIQMLLTWCFVCKW